MDTDELNVRVVQLNVSFELYFHLYYSNLNVIWGFY